MTASFIFLNSVAKLYSDLGIECMNRMNGENSIEKHECGFSFSLMIVKIVIMRSEVVFF